MIRLGSFALRGATLGSKLLLVFFLAKFFKAEDFAIFGLLSVSVAYTIYFAGFDFYTFSSRKFVQMDAVVLGRRVKTQFVLFCFLASVAVVPFTLALGAGGASHYAVAIALAILVFDLANQELERILDSRSDHLVAGAVLFLRSGFWCFVVVCVSAALPDLRTLPTLLIFWLAGSICGFIVAIIRIKRAGFGGWRDPIDWVWLLMGLKVALPFLIGTLAIRAITTADRYILSITGNVEILASYILFSAVCNSMQSIIDSGVLVYFYPRLIKNRLVRNNFNAIMRSLFMQVTLLIMPLSIFIVILFPNILELIGNDVYEGHLSIFYILIVSAITSAYSMVWHCGLYALGMDRAIIAANVTGLIAFAGFAAVLNQFYPYFSVPGAVLGSSVLILAVKAAVYWRVSFTESSDLTS